MRLRDDGRVVSGTHERIAGTQPFALVSDALFAGHGDVIAVNEADDGR